MYLNLMFIKGVYVCWYLLLKFFFGGGEKFVLIFKGNVGVWIFRGSDVVLSFVYRFVCRVMVFFFIEWGVLVF